MSEIDWSKFISLEYWLEGIAGATSIVPVIERDSFFFWFFIWIFFIIFSIAIAFKVSASYLHPENPVKDKLELIYTNLVWIAIVGNFWFLFRQFQVGFLGARFWLLVLLFWFILLVFYLTRYFSLYFRFEYLYFKQKVLQEKVSIKEE